MALFDFIRKKASSSMIEYIIVGLGNPGRDYAGTRHNAGFDSIDRIASACCAEIKKAKFNALTADTVCEGHRVLLMKPQTYMNLSGTAVRAASDFYKIPAERIIVICDDVNLDVGKIRVRRRGSDGGQKGLKDIISRLGENFPRIRVGVGKPPEPGSMVSWVLGRVPENLSKEYDSALDRAADAAVFIMCNDVESAMNRFN